MKMHLNLVTYIILHGEFDINSAKGEKLFLTIAQSIKKLRNF